MIALLNCRPVAALRRLFDNSRPMPRWTLCPRCGFNVGVISHYAHRLGLIRTCDHGWRTNAER